MAHKEPHDRPFAARNAEGLQCFRQFTGRAAFQAGFTRHEDDFFTALFAIVIHTAGFNLAPFPMPVLRGRIGQEGLALDVFRALRRGGSMKVDLGQDWDFWDYVGLPIQEVRERLGVAPLRAGLEGTQ